MPEDLDQTLRSICPDSEGMIMDLVAEAGIDVAPWKIKKDGSPVSNPRANPHYCYEWAFGGGDEPTALCVWHRDLRVGKGNIEYVDSVRQFALKLDSVAIEARNPAHVKSRARDQAKRARNFDLLLQRAYRKSNPIRAILLVGEDKGAEQIGWDTSKVRFRSLDVEPWFVHSYSDDDGTFRLVRGARPGQEIASQQHAVVFVDQFSIPDQPGRIKAETRVIPRSQDVRRKVLERAKGICEFCNKPGFSMDSGAIYLETHHVIPLAEGGPDIEWNVVAICPNDHRQVHFGEDRARMRTVMIDILVESEPRAREALDKLTGRR